MRPSPSTATRSKPMARSAGLAPVDHDHVLAHAAVVVREPDGRVGNLTRAGLASELREHLGGLGDARGAERMAAADQPAPRVHHYVAAIVAPPGRDDRPRLALVAEAQLLIRDHLGDREAVVDLGHIHVGRRDTGPAVRALRGELESGAP